MTTSDKISSNLGEEEKKNEIMPFQTGEQIVSSGTIGFEVQHKSLSNEPSLVLTPEQVNDLLREKNMKFYHIHYFSGSSELVMMVDDRATVNYATVMSYSDANRRISQLLGMNIKIKYIQDLIAGR